MLPEKNAYAFGKGIRVPARRRDITTAVLLLSQIPLAIFMRPVLMDSVVNSMAYTSSSSISALRNDPVCHWNHSLMDDCFDVIHAATVNATYWYFIGDSTIARPFNNFAYQSQNYTTVLKTNNIRRQNLAYYGRTSVMNEMNWTLPGDFEGPKSSTQPHWLGECVSCENQIRRVYSNQTKEQVIGYVAVSYTHLTLPTTPYV